MAIRASSSKQIDALVADLASEDEFARESAIARLTVIGARAVDRLKDLATSHPDGRVRAAALRAFEGIGDELTLPVALQAVSDADLGAACAAIAVARVFLRGSRGAEAVDRLTAVALDTRRADRVRIAALDALQDLERKTIAPLLNTLANDASAAVRDQIRGSQGSKVRKVREVQGIREVRSKRSGIGWRARPQRRRSPPCSASSSAHAIVKPQRRQSTEVIGPRSVSPRTTRWRDARAGSPSTIFVNRSTRRTQRCQLTRWPH